MAAILDAPVAPHRTRQLLHPHGQAADVVADLARLLAVADAQRRHDRDRLQALPQREPRQLFGRRELEIRPRLYAPVALLGRHVLLGSLQVAFELFIDVIDDRLMERLLVPLQRQDVVGLAVDDIRRDRLLGPIASMVMIAPLMSTSLSTRGSP